MAYRHRFRKSRACHQNKRSAARVLRNFNASASDISMRDIEAQAHKYACIGH